MKLFSAAAWNFANIFGFPQSRLGILTASALGIVAVAAHPAWTIPVLICVVSALTGAVCTDAAWRRTLEPTPQPAVPALPDEFPPVCREIVAGILAVVAHPDGVFRELMAPRFALWSSQMRDWAHGRLVFPDTEVWRTAYEKVLTAPEISEYRSVAWIKSEHYWQDRPGQSGMRVNYELLDKGVRIERILILGWNVWPPELRLPREHIRRWIEDQHFRGVTVLLLRENDLVGEPDLLRDFGIYGDRAVGELHIDDESRTTSFTLWFDSAAVELAREQWDRLKLYARPYQDLIEPPAFRPAS